MTGESTETIASLQLKLDGLKAIIENRDARIQALEEAGKSALHDLETTNLLETVSDGTTFPIIHNSIPLLREALGYGANSQLPKWRKNKADAAAAVNAKARRK